MDFFGELRGAIRRRCGKVPSEIEEIIEEVTDATIEALKEMNPFLFSWMAGVLESEGCIYIHRMKPNKTRQTITPQHELGIKIACTDRDFVEPFLQAFGGSMNLKKRQRLEWSPVYTWRVYHNKAHNVLVALLPFFRSGNKELQAKIAIQFHEGRTTTYPLTDQELNWRDMHYWLMRYLKGNSSKRGFIGALKLGNIG